MTTIETVELEPLKRLAKDMKTAAVTLSASEARFLVGNYYTMQDQRIRAGGQIRSMKESGEPHTVLAFFEAQSAALEDQIKKALAAYAESKRVGRWCLSICGIGPVITAGLLAHVNIEKAPTAGHLWSFAGLNPSVKWLGREGAKKLLGEVMEGGCEDGEGDSEDAVDPSAMNVEDIAALEDVLRETGTQLSRNQIVRVAALSKRTLGNLIRLAKDEKGRITKASMLSVLAKRPWNSELKTLCAFKMGECFVKVQNNPKDYYGTVFAERKRLEQEKNEAGGFREEALARVGSVGKGTDAFKHLSAGMLPPAHIHARARRYAVKLFLSHYHYVAFVDRYGKEPVQPYALEHLGHAHFIEPPNWPVE